MHSTAELIFSAVLWSVSYPHHVALFLFPGWINSVTNQKASIVARETQAISVVV